METPHGRRLPGNPMVWLILLLAGTGGYRLSLIGSGHFYTGDEHRYLSTEALVDDFSVGAYREGVSHLFEVIIRPGFVLVSTLPVLAQRAVGDMMGIERGTLAYYDTVAAFNVLVTLGIAGCVFAIARTWTHSPWWALLIVGVHSLLSGANVYVRHLVPYYEALLLFLLGLLILVRVSADAGGYRRRFIAAGALSALGFACYPGYYALAVVNGAVAMTVPGDGRARRMGWFGAGAVGVVLGFEALARWSGGVYLGDVLAAPQLYARLIKVGLCAEGYVFIWRYLCDVEGLVGVGLAVLFLYFMVFGAWGRGGCVPRSARIALLTLVVCYLYHATQAFVRHRTVFYARVMPMYLPFLVCGAGLGLVHLRRVRLRALATGALVFTSVWSFVSFASWYGRVVYPADFLFSTLEARGEPAPYAPNAIWLPWEESFGGAAQGLTPPITLVADPYPDGFYGMTASHAHARSSGARFIAVNLNWMRDIPAEDLRFELPPGYRLVAEAANPCVEPALAYEERTVSERRHLAERGYSMRIYERDAPSTSQTRGALVMGKPGEHP
ncbi:MAG: hypothetical protein GY842_20000 [bacterium]|nr:hypothetical protein [bacterium]